MALITSRSTPRVPASRVPPAPTASAPRQPPWEGFPAWHPEPPPQPPERPRNRCPPWITSILPMRSASNTARAAAPCPPSPNHGHPRFGHVARPRSRHRDRRHLPSPHGGHGGRTVLAMDQPQGIHEPPCCHEEKQRGPHPSPHAIAVARPRQPHRPVASPPLPEPQGLHTVESPHPEVPESPSGPPCPSVPRQVPRPCREGQAAGHPRVSGPGASFGTRVGPRPCSGRRHGRSRRTQGRR